jgi:hypothetical protein
MTTVDDTVGPTITDTPALFVLPPSARAVGLLANEFGIPPFTLLDTRAGPWQNRKRDWIATLGLRSEIGRDAALLGGWSTIAPDQYADDGPDTSNPIGAGTSIFDPVLCELTYHWHTAPGHYILDPFAGGSVRGIVAAYLGRNYDGIDLRPEQVAANTDAWDTISAQIPAPPDVFPLWHTADARDIPHLDLPAADLVFTCPPYYDLEVYSDDPRDLSAHPTYPAFLDTYRDALRAAIDRLADDRFAVIVVTEIRDKKTGLYRGFVPDTIAAMRQAGAAFYNDAILLNTGGSLPLRVRRQFVASRKLGRTHQNVLTFVKGDPVRATRAAGDVTITDFG